MHRSWHIAVCGCGPAGLAAALLLHRAGHRVQLFERFEQARPIGSGLILQPTGLQVLEALNVLETIQIGGSRIDRLFGRVVPSQRVVLDVRYQALGADRFGIAVHRAALFDALYQAAQHAGIEVVSGVEVTRIDERSDCADVYSRSARVGRYELVVDALGSRSPLSHSYARKTSLAYGALWVNVPWPANGFDERALEQRYRRAAQMAGVLPIGKAPGSNSRQAAFFWSLPRSHVAHWRARELNAWKREVEQLWPEAAPLLAGIVDHEQLTFAHYDHFTLRRPYSQRVVHIGDAAHSTSPQLGQGANMALLDALALARAIDASDDVLAALPLYARMRRLHVRLFQAASAIFTPFYQSDSRWLPWLRDQVAAPISRLPIADALLARLVSGMTVAPIRMSRRSFPTGRRFRDPGCGVTRL